MKITITHYGETYTADSESDDSSIDNIVNKFKGLLVAAGFHPESVDTHFNTDYQWFEDVQPEHEEVDPVGGTKHQLSYPSEFPNKHDNTFEPQLLNEND